MPSRTGHGAGECRSRRAIERQARERLQQWRAVLTRQPGEARVVLRELLEGRKITFTPLVDRRGFAFEGDAGAGGLVTGEVLAGHGNWRPHRDSNPNAVLEKLRFEIDGEVRRHAA